MFTKIRIHLFVELLYNGIFLYTQLRESVFDLFVKCIKPSNNFVFSVFNRGFN